MPGRSQIAGENGPFLEAADSADLTLPARAAAFKVNFAAFLEDPAADFSSVIRQMERSVDLTVSGK